MKVSEVFDLPVASGEKAYDSDDIFQVGGSGVWCATFCSDEQAKVAANCINHADALADALERLFESYKSLADSGDAGNWMLEDLEVGEQAIKTLAAYRGAK